MNPGWIMVLAVAGVLALIIIGLWLRSLLERPAQRPYDREERGW